MVVDKEYCMSSFLLYRRVLDRNKEFKRGCIPNSIPESWNKIGINSSLELEEHLKKSVKEATNDGKAALALSGGIDSAILAKFMPKGSIAYTFRCTAGDMPTTDETERAAAYAKECGLEHRIIEITWDDMKRYAPILMKHKNSPLHSIEVQIYMAGLRAKEDGIERIIYGETADVNYGGLSNILSKDWTVGEFVERYAYLKPWVALKNPKVDFSGILPYIMDNGLVDVPNYLAKFDIIESVNSYVNACQTAKIGFVAPFADTYLNKTLDLDRIRKGENKYMIREIFERLYKDFKVPDKIPMPRATDQWLRNWKGPTREEFIPNCAKNMTGDQKWLLWSLETFLNIMEI
ncbi:MAG: asparagine synthase-related protein [Agathobacter sp.]|uniref:asparagine synthase-related protein n=1 Tax=Agathobacter sp. TaxID=2021311 RepID=UPI00399517EC